MGRAGLGARPFWTRGLGEPVAVEFTPGESGEVQFVCGMDMQRGTIAVTS